jgi:hypothetical protein
MPWAIKYAPLLSRIIGLFRDAYKPFLGNREPQEIEVHRMSLKIASVQQAAEKVAWHGVAAGLPRHNSNDFKTRWRRKAAATPFFSSLLDG